MGNRMIHYHTKLLGMEDPISQEDILLQTEAKTRLEQELEKQKKANAVLEERLQRLEETIYRSALQEANDKVV